MNWQRAEHTCRFAPIEEWHFVNEHEKRFTEVAFRDQGLTKRPETTRTIPVLLRHEEEKVVGAVEAVWPAQGWWHARFKLNAALILSCIAADYVEVGTPVSPSSSRRAGPTTASRGSTIAPGSTTWLLLPPNRPAYQGAEVTFIVGRDPSRRTCRPRISSSERARRSASTRRARSSGRRAARCSGSADARSLGARGARGGR